VLPQLPGWLDVPPAAVVAILALVCVQLSLQVYAVADLVRRDAVTGGRKWIWALLAVLGGIPGSVLYLALGRTPAMAEGVPERTEGGRAAERAVERLYGPRRPR